MRKFKKVFKSENTSFSGFEKNGKSVEKSNFSNFKNFKNSKSSERRSCRAIVLDFKTVKKNLFIGLLGISLMTVGVSYADKLPENMYKVSPLIINDAMPILKTLNSTNTLAGDINNGIGYVFKFFVGFIPGDAETIINAAIPTVFGSSKNDLISITDNYSDNKSNSDSKSDNTSDKKFDKKSDSDAIKFAKEQSGDGQEEYNVEDIPEGKRAPIKTINAAQKAENSVGNETSYSIDINGMLTEVPKIDMSKKGPVILITHTHATEAYAPDKAEFYDVSASDRNRDSSKNVVAVGDVMAETFKANGIEVIHDTVLHDEPSFNGSYAHSLAQVEEYLKKYPSIQIVFDVHRDSIVYDDKTKARTATDIDGKSAAQLMFVVGTDEKGLYNPDWRSNMSAALHFQKEISDKYPGLMRHINLRRERFNGHTTKASMIIETGTSGNSLEEAKYAISLAAERIAAYLKTL